MVETHHPLIKRALDVVDEEMEIATVERHAFEQFRSRLSEIDPAPPPARNGTATSGSGAMATPGHVVEPAETAGGGAGPSGKSLARVRTAYRETVMAVPHFESEYGGTLRESAAAEFGPTLASRMADGRRLTRAQREGLLTAAEAAVDKRELYERDLHQEQESLREVRAGVAECERRAHALGDEVDDASGSEALGTLDARFVDLETECAELATARQQVIHGRRAGQMSGLHEESLTTLLYGELETTCPGLAGIARCVDAIRTRRRRCLG